MALYDFHCPRCGLDFEVSRSISQATEPAYCPSDGTEATRVFTMPATIQKIGLRGKPAPRPRGYSHYGHSHGPGTAGHSHRPPR
jgi:putative FmdB family regulatory protein